MNTPAVTRLSLARTLHEQLAVKVDHLIIEPLTWPQLGHVMRFDLCTGHGGYNSRAPIPYVRYHRISIRRQCLRKWSSAQDAMHIESLAPRLARGTQLGFRRHDRWRKLRFGMRFAP